MSILALLALNLQPLSAQDSLQYKMLASIPCWGEVTDVVVQDDVAFLASGKSGLKIYEISDIDNPQLLSSWNYGAANLTKLDVDGDFVYLASPKSGVFVVDISNPYEPEFIQHLRFPLNSRTLDIDTYGDLVGIANTSFNIAEKTDADTLRIINIYNPEGSCTTVNIKDTLAYLSVKTEYNYTTQEYRRCYIEILDISQPEEPDLIHRRSHYGDAGYIEILENVAYTADNERGFSIYNVSNPRDSRRIRREETEGVTHSVHVIGELLITSELEIATEEDSVSGGMGLYDISNPRDPELITRFETQGSLYSAEIYDDDIAIVASGNEGFLLIDLFDAESPELIASMGGPGIVFDMDIENRTIVTAEDGGTVSAIHIGWNGEIDFSRNQLSTADFTKVEYEPPNAYLLSRDSMFCVVGIEEENSPVLTSFIELPDRGYDLAIKDDFLFIAGNEAGILGVDVSEPSNPQNNVTLDTPAYTRAVSVRGDHAFVWDDYREYWDRVYPGGLMSFDISEPNLFSRRRLDYLEYERNSIYFPEMCVFEKVSYLRSSREANRLYRYNIEDPDSIYYKPRIQIDDGYIVDMDQDDRHLFTTLSGGQVETWDCSIPDSEFVVHTEDVGEILREISFDRNFLVVSSWTNLYIYDTSELTNIKPRWNNSPQPIRVNAGELIELEITATDENDDPLSMNLIRGGLPYGARLIDDRDGNCRFVWQTYQNDDGEYHPQFVVSDGWAADTVLVQIVVEGLNDVNGLDYPFTFELLPPYPNPFNDYTIFEFSLPTAAEIDFELHDMSGRLVYSETGVEYQQGWNSLSFQAENLPAGKYVLGVRFGEERLTQDVVLVK